MKWSVLEIIRNLVATITVMLLVWAIIVIAIEYSSEFFEGEDTEYRDDIEFLAEHVDLQILVYGDEILFPESLKCKQIESLEESEWNMSNEYVYLFINDLYGNATLTEEKFLELEEYAENHINFSYVYVGEASIQMIDKMVYAQFLEGVSDGYTYLNEDDRGYKNLSFSRGRNRSYGGLYKSAIERAKEDPTLLGEYMVGVLLEGI